MPAAPVSPAHPRTLLTGPAGSGKTHHVLERLRSVAAAEDALLVLPTYSQVTHVKRIVLSRGEARGLLDLPFTTFTGAAERFLPGFRIRGLPSAEERDRLMEEALARAGVESFQRIADRPGFRARLLRLVKEVKQTGLPVREALASLSAAAGSLPPGPRSRLDGFVAVLARYEELLDVADLEDHEDLLRRVQDALHKRSAGRVPRLLAVDGFDDLTAVEESILLALADRVTEQGGEVVVTLPFDPARPSLFSWAASLRQRLLARGFSERALCGFPRAPGGPLERIAASLFGEAPAAPLPGGAEVREILARDPEDAADLVAREVRRLVGRPVTEPRDARTPRGWRDVAVVVRSLDAQAPRLEAAFGRLGVPVRFVSWGRPLASEAVVRALRGPLGVLAGETEAGQFEPAEIVDWLRWRALFAEGRPDLLRSVDEAEVRWRQRGWPVTWSAFREDAPPAAVPALDLIEEWRARLVATSGAQAALTCLEEALSRLASLPATSGFLEDGRPRDVPHDRLVARAAAAVVRLLEIPGRTREALRRTGIGRTGIGGTAIGDGCGAAEAVRELRESLERATFSLPDPRLDAVSVMDAEEARFWEAPYVFVLGLSEGEFPLRPREDPLLRDDDREEIRRREPAIGLPLARDREARERRLLYAALTRARRGLVLVRAVADDDGGTLAASSYLRDLGKVVVPTAVPAADVPSAPTRADADLLRRAARWRRPTADPLPQEEATRVVFDASVEEVSASSLNHMAACLHRHFLSRVVGIPGDEVPFDGPAFEATDRGRVVHLALRLAVEDGTLGPEEVAERALAAAKLDAAERALLRTDVIRLVRLWRLRERETAGPWKPMAHGLERKFAVDLGGGLSLSGSIDRIDVSGDLALVIDYKSSAAGSRRGQAGADEGTDLQLPLYALAVEKSLKLSVRGLEWVTGLRRDRRGTWSDQDSRLFEGRREGTKPQVLTAEEFRNLLDGAARRAREAVGEVKKLRHGKQVLDEETCEMCEVRAVCRPPGALP